MPNFVILRRTIQHSYGTGKHLPLCSPYRASGLVQRGKPMPETASLWCLAPNFVVSQTVYTRETDTVRQEEKWLRTAVCVDADWTYGYSTHGFVNSLNLSCYRIGYWWWYPIHGTQVNSNCIKMMIMTMTSTTTISTYAYVQNTISQNFLSFYEAHIYALTTCWCPIAVCAKVQIIWRTVQAAY